MYFFDLDPKAEQVLNAIRNERDPDMYDAKGHVPNVLVEAVVLGLGTLARREDIDTDTD